MIFVFGSNLAGLHGAGAARFAERYRGAQRGVGIGLQGNSYAIPTKDKQIKTLPIDEVRYHVETFLIDAAFQPDIKFQVTCIGCGLAGFKHEDIAPMFKLAGVNCFFDEAWKPWLGENRNYWGTYENGGR